MNELHNAKDVINHCTPDHMEARIDNDMLFVHMNKNDDKLPADLVLSEEQEINAFASFVKRAYSKGESDKASEIREMIR